LPLVSREKLTAQLAEAGREREQAIEARRAATRRIAGLIPSAYRAGIGVTEIARLTGMTNRAVYDVLHESGVTPSG
jgi:DNA invertase Pin-like site-specific DNA recombinase